MQYKHVALSSLFFFWHDGSRTHGGPNTLRTAVVAVELSWHSDILGAG